MVERLTNDHVGLLKSDLTGDPRGVRACGTGHEKGLAKKVTAVAKQTTRFVFRRQKNLLPLGLDHTIKVTNDWDADGLVFSYKARIENYERAKISRKRGIPLDKVVLKEPISKENYVDKVSENIESIEKDEKKVRPQWSTTREKKGLMDKGHLLKWIREGHQKEKIVSFQQTPFGFYVSKRVDGVRKRMEALSKWKYGSLYLSIDRRGVTIIPNESGDFGKVSTEKKHKKAFPTEALQYRSSEMPFRNFIEGAYRHDQRFWGRVSNDTGRMTAAEKALLEPEVFKLERKVQDVMKNDAIRESLISNDQETLIRSFFATFLKDYFFPAFNGDGMATGQKLAEINLMVDDFVNLNTDDLYEKFVTDYTERKLSLEDDSNFIQWMKLNVFKVSTKEPQDYPHIIAGGKPLEYQDYPHLISNEYLNLSEENEAINILSEISRSLIDSQSIDGNLKKGLLESLLPDRLRDESRKEPPKKTIDDLNMNQFVDKEHHHPYHLGYINNFQGFEEEGDKTTQNPVLLGVVENEETKIKHVEYLNLENIELSAIQKAKQHLGDKSYNIYAVISKNGNNEPEITLMNQKGEGVSFVSVFKQLSDDLSKLISADKPQTLVLSQFKYESAAQGYLDQMMKSHNLYGQMGVIRIVSKESDSNKKAAILTTYGQRPQQSRFSVQTPYEATSGLHLRQVDPEINPKVYVEKTRSLIQKIQGTAKFAFGEVIAQLEKLAYLSPGMKMFKMLTWSRELQVYQYKKMQERETDYYRDIDQKITEMEAHLDKDVKAHNKIQQQIKPLSERISSLAEKLKEAKRNIDVSTFLNVETVVSWKDLGPGNKKVVRAWFVEATIDEEKRKILGIDDEADDTISYNWKNELKNRMSDKISKRLFDSYKSACSIVPSVVAYTNLKSEIAKERKSLEGAQIRVNALRESIPKLEEDIWLKKEVKDVLEKHTNFINEKIDLLSQHYNVGRANINLDELKKQAAKENDPHFNRSFVPQDTYHDGDGGDEDILS